MFDNMFETKKTLIVVYKDEMLLNQLRKMIETKDDDDSDNIVGTRDGSINIVAWDEKIWLDNKKAGTINDKILFLGTVKGTESLIPIIDIKFNSFGAYFGISGNQAVLYADTKALSDPNAYNAFFEKLSVLPVPDIIKKNPSNTDEPQTEASYKSIFDAAKGTFSKGLLKVNNKKDEIFKKKSLIERQILFFGLNSLYNDYLEEYMNL